MDSWSVERWTDGLRKRRLEKGSSHVTCHMSHVPWRMSYVTCHGKRVLLAGPSMKAHKGILLVLSGSESIKFSANPQKLCQGSGKILSLGSRKTQNA